MRALVLAFGPLKERLPEHGLSRTFTRGATVGELLQSLEQEGLFAAADLRSAAVAVNHEYAAKSQILEDGDEVAVLPPVSGGSRDAVFITRDKIDSSAETDRAKSSADGAVVVFDGIVRDNTHGRSTLHLDYQAYEDMALKQMWELRSRAIEQFGVREVVIVHRLGRLQVGETSVLIVVSSAHRAAAFSACQWVIDTLKKTVPIWKREQFVDGAVWADGEPFPENISGAAG